MRASCRRLWRFAKQRPKRSVTAAVLAPVLALNVFAYIHARAMTHFVDSGSRTATPEKLSTLQKVGVLLTGVRLPRPANHHTPADIGLDFETHSFPTADELTLHAWHAAAENSRGVCLFFHGYAAAKSSLLNEAAEFHRWGYDVFLVDLRGSGDSEGEVTTIGYREADDVAATVDYVRANLSQKPMILYGRSMGSAAVLRAVAENGVEPAAVIVECPFDRLLSTAKNRFAAMGLPGFPAAELLIFWGGQQHGYSGFEHNPADYATGVTCPALVLRGEHDPRVTAEQLESVYDNLAGPKSTHTFTGLNHEAYLTAAPDEWKATVRQFLDSLD